MNTQNGLVGFFDILGYQNLLENNEPEDIAQSVLPILTDIDTTVKTSLHNLFRGKLEDKQITIMKNIIESIKWLVFSDSILIAMPVENSGDKDNTQNWMTFMALCIELQGKLFTAGLPLRGAITYGKFYIQNAFFAGRAIIEAYKLCNKLDLAACVFTNNARKELLDQDIHNKANTGASFFKTFVVDYLVPTSTEESHYAVLAAHTYKSGKDDIRNQVLSAFWAHNKDVPLAVQSKVSNTEQWLRFLKLTETSK